MKRYSVKITSLFFALMLSTLSAFPAFAAEDNELVINGEAKVKVGDKIKFDLSLADTTEDIIGFEMRLFFDDEYLQFDKDSLEFEKFDNVYYNTELKGKIPMSWTNISEPISFSSKASFVSAEFTVLKGGESDISYFVTEMYGDDMTYLKSYTWSYDISVNGENVVSDGVLPISDDADTLANHQSGFINYEDGKGEANSPEKGDEHKAMVGDLPVGNTYNVYEDGVVTNKTVQEVTKNGGFSPILIIIIAAVILIGLVVVAVIFISKDKNKENKKA